ncbi:MAG: exopolysaccharide biosynthesis protein [Kiritimatiellae bacterium]|nr:exopolysaccharide biosynthesis protein [Kiritimatiellia bacterium]
MIDLHSHILPALDDGAPDDATALDMARQAVADGISLMVATPHYANGLGPSDPAVVTASATRFQALLDAEAIPLRIRCSMEMPLLDNLVSLYRSGTWLAYDASRRYVLFEMPPYGPRPFDILCKTVSTLHLFGVTPVLAHPERLPFLSALPDVRRLVRLGARIQVTAWAVDAPTPDGERARAWLDDGLVACVATDCHDAARRPPRLSTARDFIAGHYGQAAAEALTLTNPRLILDGAPLP